MKLFYLEHFLPRIHADIIFLRSRRGAASRFSLIYIQKRCLWSPFLPFPPSFCELLAGLSQSKGAWPLSNA